MEANREQAERALEMGQQYLRAGNPIKALRLFTKSKDMCSLSGINTWLAKAAAAVKKQQKAQSSSSSSSSRPSGPGTSRQSASSARTNASSSGSPRMRRAASAPTTSSANARPTDPIVIEILGKRTGHYYNILGVNNTASESVIKKAYRKLALKLHPDRNQTPGAADAFKRISEAYSVLEDKEKKKEFDRWGPPEEENQADGQQQQTRGNPFRRGGRRQYYENEIDPNDIFNAFFGGGFPRGHVNPHTGGGQQGNQQPEPIQQIMRLLPLLLLFLFTFLQLPSTQQKTYSLDQTTKFYKPLFTKNEHIVPKIKYYVTRDFKPQDNSMHDVEFKVESTYLDRLGTYCRQERQQQRYDLYQAQLGRDRKAQVAAQRRKMRKCDDYQKKANQIQNRRL